MKCNVTHKMKIKAHNYKNFRSHQSNQMQKHFIFIHFFKWEKIIKDKSINHLCVWSISIVSYCGSQLKRYSKRSLHSTLFKHLSIDQCKRLFLRSFHKLIFVDDACNCSFPVLSFNNCAIWMDKSSYAIRCHTITQIKYIKPNKL